MSHAETELKLLLPGAQPSTIEERLRRLGALARRREATHSLWYVYFDTPDHQLHQQRHALRLRCISDSPWRANPTRRRCVANGCRPSSQRAFPRVV